MFWKSIEGKVMYKDVILEVNGLFIIGIVIYMRLNVEILMLSLV